MNKRICIVVAFILALAVSSPGQGSASNGLPPIMVVKPEDTSDLLMIVVAADAGGGVLSSSGEASAYGGVKFGFANAILSMGYDRIQGQNGFSADISALLPVVRFPGPQKDDRKNFLRIYAEPGVGNRSGPGRFGGYFTTKVMVALLSNERLTGDGWSGSPFIEVERRFPFRAFGQGDTRISFGYMLTISGR